MWLRVFTHTSGGVAVGWSSARTGSGHARTKQTIQTSQRARRTRLIVSEALQSARLPVKLAEPAHWEVHQRPESNGLHFGLKRSRHVLRALGTLGARKRAGVRHARRANCWLLFCNSMLIVVSASSTLSPSWAQARRQGPLAPFSHATSSPTKRRSATRSNCPTASATRRSTARWANSSGHPWSMATGCAACKTATKSSPPCSMPSRERG